MRVCVKWCLVMAALSCLAAASYLANRFWFQGPKPHAPGTLRQITLASPPVQETGPARPKLPETKPPPGLPIIDWGHRDLFPVIRSPQYVNARTGDTLLFETEPVLGVVIGGQARAYSTNQLNKHEMVIDDIAGVPVLVSY